METSFEYIGLLNGKKCKGSIKAESIESAKIFVEQTTGMKDIEIIIPASQTKELPSIFSQKESKPINLPMAQNITQPPPEVQQHPLKLPYIASNSQNKKPRQKLIIGDEKTIEDKLEGILSKDGKIISITPIVSGNGKICVFVVVEYIKEDKQ